MQARRVGRCRRRRRFRYAVRRHAGRRGPAAEARLPDLHPRQRIDGDPVGGSLHPHRARRDVVPRRLEERAPRAHRLRAPVRAPDVQGLEERPDRPASDVHLARRRGRQRVHDRGCDGVSPDRAVALPPAGAVARGGPHGGRCASISARSTPSGRWSRRSAAGATRTSRSACCRRSSTTTRSNVHPYKHTAIGSMRDLEAASIDDVRGFYETYYVPENATIVVAGDVDPENTLQMIEHYLGRGPEGGQHGAAGDPARAAAAGRAAHHGRGGQLAAAGRGRGAPHHL